MKRVTHTNNYVFLHHKKKVAVERYLFKIGYGYIFDSFRVYRTRVSKKYISRKSSVQIESLLTTAPSKITTPFGVQGILQPFLLLFVRPHLMFFL